jgi:hypothetical protein
LTSVPFLADKTQKWQIFFSPFLPFTEMSFPPYSSFAKQTIFSPTNKQADKQTIQFCVYGFLLTWNVDVKMKDSGLGDSLRICLLIFRTNVFKIFSFSFSFKQELSEKKWR